MNVFVTTQMRTGSTWLCDLLSDLLKTKWIFWEKGDKIRSKRFREFINRNKSKNNVIKMHWTHPRTICSQIKQNDKKNYVLSITRDLKDVIISMILYIRYDQVVSTSPRLKRFLKIRKSINLQKATDKEYINYFVLNSSYTKTMVESWLSYNDGFSHANYKLVHYEDLINAPMKTFKDITLFLNLKTNAEKIRSILNKNSFKSKTGRERGERDNKAFRRVAIIGDYKNYLNEDSIKYIEDLLNEKN
ncbi:MAG: sulfotransferase domain-containing protein [Candidatus Odinarchaeia archaeon]|nr:MAG: sulfotransferase [Lokiarchaeota virus Fenrir Meg22_1012]URC17226.1 MAG: sulfotransferase [Lokiarchaeota virus Fenrir Meg22_1214]